MILRFYYARSLANLQHDLNCLSLKIAKLLNFGNLVLLGPPSLGKTHLAIALGVEVILLGASVYFITMPDLIGQLTKARDENRLKEKIGLLTKPKVLVDNLGHLLLAQ